jgi:hypothetical protein
VTLIYRVVVMRDRPSPALCEAPTAREFQEGDVVEVPLLLPGWQVSALESVAHQRGLTAAAMVRNLIREFIAARVPPGRAV